MRKNICILLHMLYISGSIQIFFRTLYLLSMQEFRIEIVIYSSPLQSFWKVYKCRLNVIMKGVCICDWHNNAIRQVYVGSTRCIGGCIIFKLASLLSAFPLGITNNCHFKGYLFLAVDVLNKNMNMRKVSLIPWFLYCLATKGYVQGDKPFLLMCDYWA